MHDEGFQKKLLNTDGTLNEKALEQLYEYVNKTSTEVTNLSARLNKKVNVAQGTQNAGKVLCVNKDGNVTPTPLPTIPIYGIAEVETTEGYLKTYQLYSVADGKTTYHDTKINIPRDFFLKDVELVDVTESSPLEGYEIGKYFKFTFAVDGDTERVQMLPIDTLRPCTLTAGDHIRIEGEVAEAHSFVPQYDDVSKVLPHEMQFQYTGDTTEDGQWVKDFFYRKKLVSKRVIVPKTFYVTEPIQYIDILEEGHIKPMGRYYKIPDSDLIDNLKSENETIYFLDGTKNTGDGKEYCLLPNIIHYVGDKVYCYTDEKYYTIVAKEEVTESNGIINVYISLDNGSRFVENYSYGGAAGFGWTNAYVNSTGDVIFKASSSGLIALELRKVGNKLYAYNDGIGVLYTKQTDVDWINAGESIQYAIAYGEEVYDWQQVNVQPQGIPAELEEKIHDQNTDTQLKDGAVKVTDTEVTINKPLMAGRYGQNDGTKALTIGNGTSDTDKSNATTIDLNGNIQTIGDVATPTHSLNNTLQGKVCTFEEMMAHYTAGNGMTYMIIE